MPSTLRRKNAAHRVAVEGDVTEAVDVHQADERLEFGGIEMLFEIFAGPEHRRFVFGRDADAVDQPALGGAESGFGEVERGATGVEERLLAGAA